ncbi:hypothetical protein DPMN_066173 [Dreissena polymorpha]|uniref:Reverse transcriptase domain-containing protein n=1 Tax=Dreissena polymorpha TaxID=45954 RepID=A0A9D3YTI6_DREPO|nr:hypothetical protein DPMN_066173 [Dreissena polymorpha]
MSHIKFQQHNSAIKLLEDVRQALDKDYYAAAIFMDLSKAFDCLPHDILLAKLSAYDSHIVLQPAASGQYGCLQLNNKANMNSTD